MESLANWSQRPLPERKILQGRFVRLEPLDCDKHAHDLFQASHQPDAEMRFRYLFENAPISEEEVIQWCVESAVKNDPLFFAVIDQKSGRVTGRQALMRMDRQNGVIEMGHVYWGPDMRQSPLATEAQYLFVSHVFDVLGYRRYEWKCNDENVPSKQAALRFGFTYEGLFRQHMVQKGKNRDTAWFSIIDKEWPGLKRAYQLWLDQSNFDEKGRQIIKLADFIRQERKS